MDNSFLVWWSNSWIIFGQIPLMADIRKQTSLNTMHIAYLFFLFISYTKQQDLEKMNFKTLFNIINHNIIIAVYKDNGL